MEKLYVEGNKILNGHVIISGSKNAALPILFMTILTEGKIKIGNIPNLTDINIALKLLVYLGVKITGNETLCIDASSINIFCPPYNLINKIRASIWILGPLLARFGKAKIFLPGGCKIGSRPIDLHLNGLTQLGATINLKNNCIDAYVKGRLQGKYILMEKISVGATITIMSAATLAKGSTIIDNAACEPEIVDIAKFLNTLGADIIGAGSNKICIKGVLKLTGGTHQVIPDRIETGTFLVAAAASQGHITCHKTEPKHLTNVLMKLTEAGAKIKTGKDWIKLDMRGKRPKSLNICTAPYPGFPTDMQAQFALLNSISKGIGTITETIFENRFIYTSELIRMGAKIKIKNNTIICCGIPKLISSNVFSSDLRASATLILAGCIAAGITIVNHTYHLVRGYESFPKKLNKIGANIKII
ncbi:UDP-N-acetylglucosamine 1-carboxyvinyltransferase [Buchnera aphidicola]|uniref:UDP-N-acetylglucosamine 1-carboxyvinyltransferase n=1 Tax=Buchnera aphidicola subsp. Acyrthosiphon pisum (strain Tuc7) TaxID=561501 RepID=MURA_BUCAT|nr:UDP-N-acetylglucosamine 1-carboxyvinyltransferase [Buchnera aphidicola]B8D7S1.1 RecName: Full=UDP-N-acetylglucosamine 1-carboxyvinyltransferase; AltName: Full=Enoylpyruvate transferase; AltName: Full=UDP-N-acetylglucosamine enolpyruvyl transferase; Short=EPT [Buchnera aphidicola str. Tuc7 (Acyrthosiphon pisum)]ACL30186.1 UDP-N-acetylglucosamine 1-carboxyvinyltransferase [Buchnera aphidicola str. Tuc7 (Acyrthosiphon pisum)]ADP66205.1 UDP-N-acetylglucosamine 1-carboxyvinyltransferase [Buchnera 